VLPEHWLADFMGQSTVPEPTVETVILFASSTKVVFVVVRT
jgi:hypothetical protein